MIIRGRKERTLPMPTNAPSIIRECIQGLTPALISARDERFVRDSIPCSNSPLTQDPAGPNVIQKITIMMVTKKGSAYNRCVSTVSIRMERICSFDSCFFFTASRTSRSMNAYRISAIAASRSVPRSVSISRTIRLIISRSAADNLRSVSRSGSPSINLVAAKRGSYPASPAGSSTRWVMA